jgi:dTDP-4-amino-4,6-dideoxygalactose transaminase
MTPFVTVLGTRGEAQSDEIRSWRGLTRHPERSKPVNELIPRIPLNDLARQYLSIKPELDEAISRVLKSGLYVSGENVKQFERELASYLGVKFVVGVGSGTDALEFSMRAIELSEGRSCIAPANTFFSIVNAVESSRGTLKLTDIETSTFNLDPNLLKTCIDSTTHALVPAHAYGQTADMDPISELKEASSCYVIEDVAQALGATYKGRMAGSIGDISCLSFYPTKNLGAFGDAGAIATNNEELAQRIRNLGNYGQETHYRHASLGRNSRLDELQAAILSVKMRHLEEWNASRRAHARLYQEYLDPIEQVSVPTTANDRQHVFSLYVIRCDNRDKLGSFLERRGIATEIHYPVPLHTQPACIHLGYRQGAFPRAEDAATKILSLPMYPELGDDEIALVCEGIRDFFRTIQ